MRYAWLWAAFAVGVVGLLAVDLGVMNRRADRQTLREAAVWSATWVGTAAAFGIAIRVTLGGTAALQFATGYVVEEALSVDNLFVFALIFAHFGVPTTVQHRVLLWGVVGAVVLRGTMIAAGAALITRFAWITYVLGGFLLVAGVRLAVRGGTSFDPSESPVMKFVRRVVPVTRDDTGSRFFAREADAAGRVRWVVTPLFVVLLVVELTDLVFAVDSIPAVFGITRDPFLVYTSNVLAVLGLRSMFAVLARVIERLRYVRFGLAIVLAFVGVTMLIVDLWAVPTLVSLAVIVSVLGASAAASLLVPERTPQRGA